MKIVSVCNLKGGSGKTTTTAYLAKAFHDMGARVAVIDTDAQESTHFWAVLAEWPYQVSLVHQPGSILALPVGGMLHRDNYDVVVIDTPPLEGRFSTTPAAMKVADFIVIPMEPTIMELGRLWPTLELVDEHGAGTAHGVLFNRVTPRVSANAIIRSAIAGAGRHVFDTTIPRRQAIAQAAGQPITELFGFDLIAQQIAHKIGGLNIAQ